MDKYLKPVKKATKKVIDNTPVAAEVANLVNGKRKASPSSETPTSKKPAKEKNGVPAFKGDHHPEENGVVLREFYPPEMSNARATQYRSNEIKRPMEELKDAIEETEHERVKVKTAAAVVHWYKCDLRLRDNTALHLAAEKAKEAGVPLICLYVISPQDLQAHLTAPVRVDFILRTLEILKEELATLDIPLYVETVEKRKRVLGRIMELLGEWGASHLYANIEYEVDELRREARMTRMCLEKGIAFTAVHDTCVVQPGLLSAKASGNQYAVYSPWYKAWMAYLQQHMDTFDLKPPPGRNPGSAREKFKYLFECGIPEAPENKALSEEEKKRLRSLWPAGELEARRRLEKFAKERIGQYANERNIPSTSGTSKLSVHLAAGTLSARTVVKVARDANGGAKLDSGNNGIKVWISEVAWRDFYKHVLVNWPYVCMYKPFKPEYTNIQWEYSDEHFSRWTKGQTGYPLVDAAMRQLNATAWMHNRCRMVVASFLAKHLLLDWRMGERYFMEHLVDGDFASNNGGWGWSASCGVDPQPYFRIFNPTAQSERFDEAGEYIREWVPELRGVQGKAVHEPWERCQGKERRELEKSGYPRPIVEHRLARERCLRRFKEGIGRETS